MGLLYNDFIALLVLAVQDNMHELELLQRETEQLFTAHNEYHEIYERKEEEDFAKLEEGYPKNLVQFALLGCILHFFFPHCHFRPKHVMNSDSQH